MPADYKGHLPRLFSSNEDVDVPENRRWLRLACLTNTEKQARYRERHLGVGEKMRVGLILDAGTRAQLGRLARHKHYTITALVEDRGRRTAGNGKVVRQGSQDVLRWRIDAASPKHG